jgi:exopolyphosphatase/guanosine-5'-triphosphate,3'-diphosphate pyrophosphatase
MNFIRDCRAHHPVIAAIDLGTNSCRLLIVRLNVAGERSNFLRIFSKALPWKVIDSYSRVIRLGEGLQHTPLLSENAIERAIESLQICKKKLDRYSISKLRVVATEACRRAKNANILIDRAKKELGLSIDIIDAKEEARLALRGCSAVLDRRLEYSIIFDIGGGSTEVSFIQKLNKKKGAIPLFDVIDSVSLPHGVVTSSEALAQAIDIKVAQEDLLNSVQNILKEFSLKHHIQEHINNQNIQMLGTSGTVTTLAAIHFGLVQYSRKAIDGTVLNTSSFLKVIDNVLAIKETDELHPCISPNFLEYAITGSLILKGICLNLPVDKIRVADRGVREGVLNDLAATI